MHGSIIYVILSTLFNFISAKTNILCADDIPDKDVDLNKHIKGLKHWDRESTTITM